LQRIRLGCALATSLLAVFVAGARSVNAQSAARFPARDTARTAQATETAAPDSSHVQKTFFTRRDAVLTGAALAGSAVVSIFDERISHWAQQPSVQGSSSRHDLVDNLTVINEQPLTIAAVATYGIGRLTGSETVSDIGLHTTEALVLTVGISELVRGPLGRLRPHESPNDAFDFKFWRGFTDFAGRSYPSLHAAVAFATAASVTGEVHERWPGAAPYVGTVLYAAAMVPGLTRIYLNQHWTSDVVAGAFVGQLLGSRVVKYAHSHRRSRLDRVLLGTSVVPTSGGVLVMVNTRGLAGGK
jgi:hypothetical protein